MRPIQVNTFSSKFNEFDILQNLAALEALNIIINAFKYEIIQKAILLYFYSFPNLAEVALDGLIRYSSEQGLGK